MVSWANAVVNSCKLAELSVKCISKLATLVWNANGRTTMLANQPEKRLCHRSCRFVLESFYFWPFAKEACASGYVFISSFCSWKGTNQIYPYSMLNLVSDWDWMDVWWSLRVGMLTFVIGLSHSIHLWWYPPSSIVPQSSPFCPFQSVLHWLYGSLCKLGGLAVSAHILSPTGIYNIGTKKCLCE